MAPGIAILPLYMALESATSPSDFVLILRGWQPKPEGPCRAVLRQRLFDPLVEVFLDFIDKYLRTDLDPRLRGTKARGLLYGS